MEVYRLSREKFARELSGKGAALRGARWNGAGVEVIYVATNRSLAMAEVAVHLSLATMPGDYMMVTILIPDEVRIKKLSAAQLPQDWNQFPHPSSTQQIGNRFIAENKYAVLRVPSAVTKGDYNLLINPAHPDCKKIKITSIEKFPFDKRIFK